MALLQRLSERAALKKTPTTTFSDRAYKEGMTPCAVITAQLWYAYVHYSMDSFAVRAHTTEP
jgi:hypothetical protein